MSRLRQTSPFADATQCPSEATLVLFVDAVFDEEALDESALDRPTCRTVEAHLALCADCHAKTEALAQLDSLLADVEPAPAGLHTRLLEIPTSTPSGTPGPLAVAAVAAAVLLGIGLFAMHHDPADHTPEDLRPETLHQEVPSAATPTTAVVQTQPKDLPTRIREALAARPSGSSAAGSDDVGGVFAEYGERAAPALHAIARGSDAMLARRAIERLGRMGLSASLPVLILVLDHPDRRGAAIDALASLGDEDAVPALAPLVDHLTHGPAALRAVITIGGADAVDVLVARAADAEVAEAGLLVAELARIDGPQGTRALARLFAERQDLAGAIRVAVAGQASVRTHLAEAALGLDDDNAARALSLLAHVATDDLVEALVPLLDDRGRRGQAARVLARIDTHAAAEALIAHVADAEIRAAFDQAGPVIEAWLGERIASGTRHERRRSIALLASCGTSASLDALVDATSDRALAPHAIEAIGLIGGRLDDSEAVAVLSELANRRRLRTHVVAALGASASPDAIPVLARLGTERALRGPAIDALSNIPHPEAVEAIVRLDGGRKVRSGTARALRTMDRDVVTGTLTAMLDTDSARGARHALSAVRSDRHP